MYDKHIIFPGSLRNVGADGKEGFSLGVRLPYYRGQPFSIVEDIAITVDGKDVPRSEVRFSVRGQRWTLDEMTALTEERWEFGEVADVIVLRPGGLPAGEHEVGAAIQLRISYLPWSSVTRCTRKESV